MITQTIPYWHVDAFAAATFGGNQAAVMVLEQWLPDATLQAIAAENLFAETAFVVRDDSGAGGEAIQRLGNHHGGHFIHISPIGR